MNCLKKSKRGSQNAGLQFHGLVECVEVRHAMASARKGNKMDPWEVKTELEKKWPGYAAKVMSAAYDGWDYPVWDIYMGSPSFELEDYLAKIQELMN